MHAISPRKSEQELAVIRARVAALGWRVAGAVRGSVAALLDGDLAASATVALADLAINREVRALDARCHRFVASQLPSAGHLRLVSSVLRLNISLERIGDHAVTIAREAQQLGGPPRVLVPELRGVFTQVDALLSAALRAWETGDAALARETTGRVAAVNRSQERLLRSVLEGGASAPAPLAELYALLVVFSSLGRVGDQAKNLCEETIFTVTGQAKAPKVYQVLFVDRDNAGLSQLAQAIARAGFPESGDYHSGGWEPAPRIDPGLVELMDRWGLVLPHPRPVAAPSSAQALARFHVVVSLSPGARLALPALPFRTVLLRWALGAHPGADPEDPAVQARFATLHARLASAIQALMVQLRGEGAR